jgi:imidazolonepropionase-like amidohydrolase
MHPESLILDLWDGESHRGVSTIRWTADPAAPAHDAVIESVTAADPDPQIAAARSEFSVIPGLIDTHVHLIGYAGDRRQDFLSWPLVTRPEEQVLHGLANARKALAAGVTTLRDLSADDVQFSLRRAIDAGIVEAPRLQAFGMVGMTAGHADLFIPPAFPIRKPTADGPDACRALVRHWARAGADGIKIATSGGVLSVGDKSAWRNYTRAEIAAIVDEAHALGMRVAAHAHTVEGIEIALAEGVDSIEHGTLLDDPAAVTAAGVTIAPTLLINEVIASGGGGVSPEQAEKARELVGRRNGLLRAAADAGVDFVLGTDANANHVAFGDQMAEVRRMAEVFGWSASRALEAATSRAAAAIGRDDLGRIRPGSRADLVVMRGRPWENIDDLRVENIVAVMSRGRMVAGAAGLGAVAF